MAQLLFRLYFLLLAGTRAAGCKIQIELTSSVVLTRSSHAAWYRERLGASMISELCIRSHFFC